MCTRRCDAAHEGTRTSHFCSEHGSPLKRGLDALVAECSSRLAGAGEELTEDQLDDWMAEFLAETGLDQDSAGEDSFAFAELVSDV